jgi:hypothetical protein
MKAIVLAAATMIAAQAHADGFSCTSESGNLKVTVYNNVNPNTGTRTPARMIVSNPNEAAGSKTAAVFNADSGTLTMGENESAADTDKVYVGKVDLRFSQISAKDADLLGSRLADLASVSLAVDFKFGDNLAKGEEVDALITLEKRDGGIIKEQAQCERYLKGE